MTRPRALYLSLMCLFLALTVPATLAAQSQATTGVIRGVVTDPAGDPVDGAIVVLRETQTNFERTLQTSGNGAFVASLLPLGTYEVTVRAVGLQESRRTGLVLRVGQTADLQISLRGAVALEALVVEATVPLVDPAQTEASTRLPVDAVSGLPNNGRDFLNLTTLTPNVKIVQGPDGDELTIGGQRGIHNNIAVDGADFNNPFFGEQRGGQRPPFTFNLDAVEEIVVISQGANAEFGRSGGGFVNVITKSGTNEFHGSAHYFGKYDALSGDPSHAGLTREPDFQQHQFGFTLGGPIVRDKAFFFVAYDQQVFDDTRQKEGNRITRFADGAKLAAFIDTAFGGALKGDDGPIARTDEARAVLAKFDFRLSDRHNASLKYNYTWSEQENGTFDVDTWLRSSNGLEKDFSHAINGSLSSIISPSVSNEFRFQWSREDRPRPYLGTTIPGTTAPPGVETVTGERPFPDTGMDFVSGFRFGMPFFLPIKYYDSRIQILDNVSIVAGDHLFKFGAEWNRVESVQTFIGFANGRFIFSSVDGFLNYVADGNQYVECSDGTSGTSSTTATCLEAPPTSTIVGPVLLYLQQAGVPPFTVEEAGTQSIPQHEVALFVQDSWKPHPNVTLNYGIRWEASIQPDVRTPPSQVFFAPLIGQTVTTSAGPQEFPSDGTIPSDYDNFQPRFGLAWDVKGDRKSVVRASAGLYYARIPGLNLASTRSTNGSIGQTLFGSSATIPIGLAPPNYDELLPSPPGGPVLPDIFVFNKDFVNPRTFSATVAYEQELPQGFAASISYTHSRTDNLTRFINRNAAVFGNPWTPVLFGGGLVAGLPPDFDGDGVGDNGIFTGTPGVGGSGLITVESTAKSRFNGITFGLKRMLDPVQFQINYTLSYDKSDDDNERDPFTFRYARADNLEPEFNWSDRDQRHRLNAWLLAKLPGDIFINNRVSAYSAQPTSESCGPSPFSAFAPPRGERATSPIDRNCADGSVLKRNTLRKDNAFFSWDIRFSRLFRAGAYGAFEAIIEVFNVTNTDNFLDPGLGSLLFNFDGTIRSGLGEPRQAQVGLRYIF